MWSYSLYFTWNPQTVTMIKSLLTHISVSRVIGNTPNVCGHQLWFSLRRLTFSSRLGEFGGCLCNNRLVQVQQQPLQCGTGRLWNQNWRRLNCSDRGGGGEPRMGEQTPRDAGASGYSWWKPEIQRVGPFLDMMSDLSMLLTPVHATTKTGSWPTTCEDNFTSCRAD